MSRPLGAWIDAGLLDDAAAQFVAALDRLAGPLPDSVALAAALAVRAPGDGDVCADLTLAPELARSADPAPGDATVEAAAGLVSPSDLPALEAWLAELVTSPLVEVADLPANPPEPFVRPLVLAGSRVYLRRYWRYEQHVARHVTARTQQPESARTAREPLPTGAAVIDLTVDARRADVLARLFSADPVDAQRRAADAMLTRPLTVVAGGPGTGKTRTIARALLAATELTDRPLAIALAAPTGKAAARLNDALRRELAALAPAWSQAPSPVSAAITGAASDRPGTLAELEATTLHRLLGAGGRGRFRHHAGDPLPHDLVVVDEVSMVSLPLVARLLDALGERTRLVLVGDPYQLASVDAGTVLRDLVGPAPQAAAHVVVLDRVHRFGADSPIAALAEAVREGCADDALALLSSTDQAALRWVEPLDQAARAGLEAELVDRAVALARSARADEPALTLAHLGSSQVLCATRRGPASVEDWNERIETGLAHRLGDPFLARRAYPGQPVLVTANDYPNGLFNGDTGVVVSGERRGVLDAFPGQAGAGLPPVGPAPAGPAGADPAVRLFDPARLAELTTCWASTVHKSQGSEYGRVVVSLPEPGSLALSRELLYTAITRARDQVTLVASEASVRAAIERPVRRASGLRDLLWPTRPYAAIGGLAG